jgi:hypothetical protein
MYRGRGTPFDNHPGEGAVAAADIEPSHRCSRGEPIEEFLTDQLTPRTHVPLVGRPIVEADLIGRHDGHFRGGLERVPDAAAGQDRMMTIDLIPTSRAAMCSSPPRGGQSPCSILL